MVILDTSIIIDHLRQPGKKSALDQALEKIPQNQLAISVITIQELYEGQSTREEVKEKSLLAVVASLKVLPYTFEIAQKAGQILRDINTPVEFPDAAIAATAIIQEAQVMTLNKKHFKDIPNLQII